MNRLSRFAVITALVTFAGCGGPSTPDPDPEPKIIQPRFSLDTSPDILEGLAISPDGKLLVSRSRSDYKSIRIWDLAKKTNLYTFDAGVQRSYAAVAPDGKLAAFISTGPDSISLFDLTVGKELRRLRKQDSKFGEPISGLAFSPQGNLLAAAWGKSIIGWDPRTGEQRFVWQADGDINALSGFFDDGNKIATGQQTPDSAVKVWDVAAGKPVADFPAARSRIRYLAAAPDGKTLAALFAIDKIRLWDVATGGLGKEVDQQQGMYTNLVFVDNKTIAFGGASGQKDDKIYLVNVDSHRITHRLEGHTDSITSLAVTSDGTVLVSAATDHTIKVWDLK
jgi:WD40 repeat protein